jgi:hypothetical protein
MHCLHFSSEIKVAPAPCTKNGYITFGSFNNLAKVEPPLPHDRASVMLRTVVAFIPRPLFC